MRGVSESLAGRVAILELPPFSHSEYPRHAQEFHAAELARELGISQPTVKSWGGILEASYIGYFLPPWHRNYGKRVVKASKFYFLDAALVSLLTHQSDATAALAGGCTAKSFIIGGGRCP